MLSVYFKKMQLKICVCLSCLHMSKSLYLLRILGPYTMNEAEYLYSVCGRKNEVSMRE